MLQIRETALWDICAEAVITEVRAMINEETRRKLRELNMGEFVIELEIKQFDPTTIALPFDERMQRLTDYVYQEKYNGRIQRLI